MSYHVRYLIYPVDDDFEPGDTDGWFEYFVELIDGDRVVDSWDSLFETYNGVPNQRLTKDGARRAAQEIQHDVMDGGASFWFDV